MRKPLTPTQKARRSVQAKIRRLEKKGEYVPTTVKEIVKQARFQTLESLRRSKFSRLYKEIETAISEEEWQNKRRIADKNLGIGNAPVSDDIILTNVQKEIHLFDTKGAQALRKALSTEIRKYGRKNVAQAMEEGGEDLIALAHTISAYVDSSDTIHTAMQAFFENIRSGIATNSEAESMGDIMDEMTDMGYES